MLVDYVSAKLRQVLCLQRTKGWPSIVVCARLRQVLCLQRAKGWQQIAISASEIICNTAPLKFFGDIMLPTMTGGHLTGRTLRTRQLRHGGRSAGCILDLYRLCLTKRSTHRNEVESNPFRVTSWGADEDKLNNDSALRIKNSKSLNNKECCSMFT